MTCVLAFIVSQKFPGDKGELAQVLTIIACSLLNSVCFTLYLQSRRHPVTECINYFCGDGL